MSDILAKFVSGQQDTAALQQSEAGVVNGTQWIGFTESASNPTTNDYPEAGDCGIHHNTGSGAVYFVYNRSGVIKKVQLT